MKKPQKICQIVNMVFLGLILIADSLFITRAVKVDIIKPIASILFVLCGLFNYLYIDKYHSSKHQLKGLVLLGGLIFAFAGDVVLTYHFLIGAILFAIAHIFFLVYFSFISQVNWIDMLCTAILLTFTMLMILLYPHFDFKGMDLMIMVYAAVISLMTGKAIANFIKKRSFGTLILMAGAVLFLFSDIMLVFNNFASLDIIFDHLCLASYYPAEFLLAYGLLIHGIELTDKPLKSSKKDNSEKEKKEEKKA